MCNSGTKSDLPDDLGHLVRDECFKYGASGATLTVARGDECHTYAAGSVGFDSDDPPVTPQTAFSTACAVKLFTSALVLKILAERAMPLDLPVSEVLPSFIGREDISLRHLLAHTSGLDDAYMDESDFGIFAAKAASLRQNARAGSQFSYCHNGYALLGAVTERISGLSWEQALRDGLLEPLGISDPFGSAPWPRTAAHAWGKFGAPQIVRPRCYRPAGVPEITFSTEAVAKLTRLFFHASEELMPWSVKAEALKPHGLAAEGHPIFDHVGLAWRLGRAGQASVRGVAAGSTTSVILVSGADLSIVAACNAAPQGRGPILEKAINHVLSSVTGVEFGSARTIPGSKEQDEPAAYCGRYVASFRARHNEIVVESREDGLHVIYSARSQISGRQFPVMEAKLVPEDDGTFLLTGRPGVPIERLRFVRNEQGEISHFRTAESLYYREA